MLQKNQTNDFHVLFVHWVSHILQSRLSMDLVRGYPVRWPSIGHRIHHTLAKTNECSLKRDYFNRKYIFQPVIFRGHVSFSGRNSTHLHHEYLMPPTPSAWPQPWQLMPRCWLLWLKETSHRAARQCFLRLMLLLVDLDHRNPIPHKPTPTRKEGLMGPSQVTTKTVDYCSLPKP